jgi:hypothetical protein
MAVRWLAAVAVLVLGMPAMGRAQQFPGVYGRKLLISDAGSESQRKIVVKIVNAGLDTATMNPPANGLFLHVYNSAGTSDSACMPLPASGWKASGSGFRYSDPTSANGPCRVAVVKRAKLFKAVCTATRSPITFSLDERAQASVTVTFSGGGIAYCADFGGAERGDVPGKKFMGKNSSPPLFCPPAPVACPAES